MLSSLRLPKRRGEWAELQFASKATLRGFTVSRPWGDSAPYDFVLEHDGKFMSIQVKSTTYKAGNSYVCNIRANANHSYYTAKEVDFMALYIIPKDIWYIVPIQEALKVKSSLFLNPHDLNSKYKKFKEAWQLFTKR